MVAWELVYKTKSNGGLDVINLSIENECLLMKYHHKFCKKHNLPWVKLVWESYYQAELPHAKIKVVFLWCRDCLKLLKPYKELASCGVKEGNAMMLWQDKWYFYPLKDKLPHLYSFAKNKNTSILQGACIKIVYYPYVWKKPLTELNQNDTLESHKYKILLIPGPISGIIPTSLWQRLITTWLVNLKPI